MISSFQSIFGHKYAIRALQKSLEHDTMAGTYLFTGPPGVGKTSLALAFAAAAACTNPRRSPYDACGQCRSCRMAASGAHPEIVLIPPAGDQTQIWQFWDRDNKPTGALQHTLNYAPGIGRKRVYIIERADTLNESAANSLLKSLEEPPPYAFFILLAPHPGRMLPTILSRSRIVRLIPEPVEDLTHYLSEQFSISYDKARSFAVFAEGCPGSAHRLASNTQASQELSDAMALAITIPTSSPLRALKIAESIRKMAGNIKAFSGDAPPSVQSEDSSAEPAQKERVSRRQLGLLLELLITFYRDLLTIRLNGEESGIVHGEYRAALAEIALRSGSDRWMTSLETLLSARRRVDRNASVPLLTDWLAVKLVCS